MESLTVNPTKQPKKLPKKSLLLAAGGLLAVVIAIVLFKRKKSSTTASTASSSGNSAADKASKETDNGTTSTTNPISITIDSIVVSAVEADPQNVLHGKYSVSAMVGVINSPSSGTLSISINNKVVRTVSFPVGDSGFGQNKVFVLSFEVADGLEHNISANIDTTKATKTVKYTSPASL